VARKKTETAETVETAEGTGTGNPAESERPFLASDPPHEGHINEDLPPEESADAAPPAAGVPARRGRPPGSGTKKKGKPVLAPGVDPLEPTPGEIDNAKDLTELCLFVPTEMIFDFEPPKADLQLKIARLEARLWKKHVSSTVSDEYALVGLLAIWLLTNIATVMFGPKSKKKSEVGSGQRNHGNLRAQKDGENPLDAPLPSRAN